MAQLSSLPNELLRHILGHVMPEDLENFAQVSKHIRSISNSALEEHRQLIRKYTSLTGLAVGGAVEPLLKDVLADPRIGNYVKRIDLCGVLREDLEDEDENGQEIDMEDGSVEARKDDSEKGISIEQLHAAVDENQLLNPEHLRLIHKRIDKGRKDSLLCLLLPLLPNLSTLSIANRVYDEEQLYMMIERARNLDARFLSKLEHVHIQAYNYEHNMECFMLDYLTAFVPLPSLRRLSGMRVWRRGWGRELLEPPQISNITHLELRESMIGSRVLDRYLRNFPHLQSFVYTSSCEGYPDDDFDPFVIRTALEARVSTTLQKLTIWSNSGDEKTLFMGPLCGFKVLKHVHGDLGCFIPCVKDDEREILSLILPKSLRVLNLRGYGSRHNALIDQAIAVKTRPDSPLPLLETLVFTMASPASYILPGDPYKILDGGTRVLQQRCDEVGLSLVFKDTEDRVWFSEIQKAHSTWGHEYSCWCFKLH